MPPKTPSWWESRGALTTLLTPLSWLYYAAARLREAATTPERFPVPVFCVGNAVAGGAGKTPVALWIGTYAKAEGCNAFFVTRGYGGSARGPLRVETHHAAAEVGDEALLLSRVLPTIMCKSRRAGVRAAIDAGATLVIMDDGLQNPTVAKDCTLLVADSYGFGNGHMLPAGPLREPVANALAKADAVVVIGAADISGKAVFHAALEPVGNTLQGKKVIGFAGIGRPEKFRATLQALDCHIAAFHPFPDHHPYTPSELEALQREASQSQATLVTTEKDAARLSAFWQAKVTSVPIRLIVQEDAALMALLREKGLCKN